MLISAIPFSLFGVLVYFPPVGYESWVNILWLAVTVLLFYFFFVMYTIPYTALISELGHTPNERLTISTVIGVTWALGFLVGNLVYALQPLYQNAFGMTSVAAFQAVLATFGVVSSILMFLPIIFIDEYKYAEFHVSNENMMDALKSTFRNKYFVKYISSELFYWICLNIIQAGLVYYVTTLLGLEKSIVSALMAVMFLLSFVYYLPINIVARKFQKKIVVQFAFIVFSLCFFLSAGMGILPIPAMVYAFGIVIIAALPIAIFGILPNAIVADIAEADGISSGNYKAGIFFGVRTFEMNVGISIANILFPSFLALGKSVENPFGIHLSAIVAGIFCLVGFGIFMLYNEKDVFQIIASKKS
jgi:Na+/melibiose symporter-like transporter